jgi:FRG domain
MSTHSGRPLKPKKRLKNVVDPEESEEVWRKFLNKIANACRRLRCGEPGGAEAWFRGHDRSSYPLLPSLFRTFEEPNKAKNWKKIWNMESDLFWEFAARARELHGQIEDDWDILFAMQHYGTPTRLLDWTEVLSAAVYFAVLGVDENQRTEGEGKEEKAIPPPCVWVLNPYKLNHSTGWAYRARDADLVHPPNLGWEPRRREFYSYGDLLSEPEIDWDWPVAIYPRQRNARMHAQRAWFTIHGDKFVPMQEVDGRKEYLRKVELPFDALPAARNFLELAGVNHYLLFADLESLSLHLQEKNGFVTRQKAATKARARLDRRDVIPRDRN